MSLREGLGHVRSSLSCSFGFTLSDFGVCANMFVQESLFTRFDKRWVKKKVKDISIFKSLFVVVQMPHVYRDDYINMHKSIHSHSARGSHPRCLKVPKGQWEIKLRAGIKPAIVPPNSSYGSRDNTSRRRPSIHSQGIHWLTKTARRSFPRGRVGRGWGPAGRWC